MYILIYLLGIILDQVSKFLIKTNMELYQSLPVIQDVFHLTFTLNTGGAFSIFTGQRWIFVCFTLIALVVIVFFYRRIPRENKKLRFAVALLASGATGNFIDRLLRGYVVDFLDFRFWPVFNIADCLIVIAIILIVWRIIFHGKEFDVILNNKKAENYLEE